MILIEDECPELQPGYGGSSGSNVSSFDTSYVPPQGMPMSYGTQHPVFQMAQMAMPILPFGTQVIGMCGPIGPLGNIGNMGMNKGNMGMNMGNMVMNMG